MSHLEHQEATLSRPDPSIPVLQFHTPNGGEMCTYLFTALCSALVVRDCVIKIVFVLTPDTLGTLVFKFGVLAKRF